MIKNWQIQIHSDKSNQTIIALTQAFHAALCRISTSDEEFEHSEYKIEGKKKTYTLIYKVNVYFT